jgi:2-polyprenyl-3-methyl-5-hydroxy-6-metoxy-1,4-benzoquinol methylase
MTEREAAGGNERYFEANRALWDAWTEVHERAAFYDVDGFRAGRSTLNSIELEELGDVAGKALLHLQCHFGLDTLSLARLGARVTGVDFSERAIALARSLAAETALEAEFVLSNIYDLPAVLDREFDIVFTSYGVLPWLPDLTGWARLVHRYLKPGGVFCLVEIHPIAGALDEEGELRHPYFHSAEPLRWETQGSYADRGAAVAKTSDEWVHSVGDVVNALLGAGLGIESLREHPYVPYPCYPWLEQAEPGRWMLRGRPYTIPLTFSVRARKAAG